jgi:hypothetical protein
MDIQVTKVETLQTRDQTPPELRSDRNAKEMNSFAFGVILGAALGCFLGFVLGNLTVGVSIGIGIGLILSDVSLRQRKSLHQTRDS